MKRNLYAVVYRPYPAHEPIKRQVIGYSEDSVKLFLKYENDISHNQIEFISITKIKSL